MDLQTNDISLGNDTEKKYSGSLTGFGGILRFVIKDKANGKWAMAFAFNPIDTIIFEDLLESVATMKENDKRSMAITKFDQGKDAQIGVLRVGKSQKGNPYVHIEGMDKGGNKIVATFQLRMFPSLKPSGDEPFDVAALTLRTILTWFKRDLPLARALHNVKKDFSGKSGGGQGKAKGGAPSAPADDVDAF